VYIIGEDGVKIVADDTKVKSNNKISKKLIYAIKAALDKHKEK